MLAPDLFERIGYREKWIRSYQELCPLFGDRLEPRARAIVTEGAVVEEETQKAAPLFPGVPVEAVSLFLLLEATGYLLEAYRQNGLPDEMFYNAMCDLSCKTRECEENRGLFGTFVPRWYNGFFHLTRFAFGRLQFDLSQYEGANVALAGFPLRRGAFCLKCHIPSSGPLTEEAVLDSFRRAFAHFQDRFPDGTLVVTCHSYLLFPAYVPLFDAASTRIARFLSHFWIESVHPQSTFQDLWRLFPSFSPGVDPSRLPADTRLRRAFIRYLGTDRCFGEGCGVLLFRSPDTILTQNQYALS